jgi:hypothetical protein
MTDWNDLPVEMRRLRLDEDTMDRLLAGGIDPDDAPPGYSEVTRVLQALTAADDHEELAHEAVHVALAIEVSKQRAPVSTPPRRSRRMRSGGRRAKIGGLVVVGALVGSTGLAAAGVLPDAAQDAFSNVLDTVGITVPAGSDHPPAGSDHPKASSDHPAASGDEISEIATTTVARGVDKGAEVSSEASGGMSQAGQHGSAVAGTAAGGAGAGPVTGPNEGGTGTANAASDGASEAGTVIADERSDGHSSAGSGNAPADPPTPDRPRGP